jgi:hypothetical protein
MTERLRNVSVILPSFNGPAYEPATACEEFRKRNRWVMKVIHDWSHLLFDRWATALASDVLVEVVRQRPVRA